MCEELLPFLDHDIHDPSAARLATGVKRKKSSKDVSRAVRSMSHGMTHAHDAGMKKHVEQCATGRVALLPPAPASPNPQCCCPPTAPAGLGAAE